ncbi:hypothetical protein [Hansschlegelia sp. KR7-227]
MDDRVKELEANLEDVLMRLQVAESELVIAQDRISKLEKND